jgi:hypothetical protein
MDLIYFFGRFHVLLLHIPLGIIVAIFVLELLARKNTYGISQRRRRSSGRPPRCPQSRP